MMGTQIDLDLVELAKDTLAGVEQMVLQGRHQSAERLIRDALVRAEVGAVTRWAWWKDGIEYVGSCGTTRVTAIKEIHERADIKPSTDGE
jgi:hypothetical protein